MILNPYENVDWNNAISVKSITHEHIVDQAKFDRAVERGYQHIAVSHYNPSVPVYPLSQSPYFTNVPSYMLGSPNTEKSKATNTMNHICSLGSFCEGYGVPDQPTKPWQGVFDDVLSQLQFEDGGGITINHPRGDARQNIDLVTSELDYDPRVLGMEIFNNSASPENQSLDRIYMLQLWDAILSTGRRCWGFSVVDWDIPESYGTAKGSHILLVPEYTEHACLRAYRNGEFYCLVDDTGLRFTNISANENTVYVSTNRTCNIQFYTDAGLAESVSGVSASYNVKSSDIYVRIEAREDDAFKRILSNPIRYKNQDEVEIMKHREKIKRYASILLK